MEIGRGTSTGPFLLAVAIRLGVGAGLAAAAGSSGQVAGAFGAVAVGVAAPLIVEKLYQQIPRVAVESDGAGSAIPSQAGVPAVGGSSADLGVDTAGSDSVDDNVKESGNAR
jgi:hypothetical protein